MQIELDITANGNSQDVVLEIYLNQSKIFNTTADNQIHTVCLDISEDPADHVLTVKMNGKNRTHTVVDSNGSIVQDVYFEISRLEFDGLDMKDFYCLGKQCYTHSFNSARPEILDEFYGAMGCNGVVNLEFSTPIYLWMYHNLEDY